MRWLTVVAALFAFPAGAEAASVTVQSDSGTRSFELGSLRQDINQEYTVASAAGDQRVPVRGTSLNALIEAAKPDTFGVRSYEISGGGRTVVLAPDQLTGAGQGSPVVYAENGQAVFLRPRYSADDLNGNDRLTASTLKVRVLKRPTLKVSAKASDAAVEVGELVTFSATTTGAAAGKKLDFNWTFGGDGSPRQSGQKVTHRFRETGSYVVSVGATTADDRTGASGFISVRVGPAPKGPEREGGGTSADSAAPSSGTAAGGNSGASGGTGEAATGPARSSRPATRRRAPRRAITPGGRRVEGTLLADATVVPRPRPAARQRAARTGRERDENGGFQVPGVAVGALVVLGLGGAGAAIELRPLIPWPRRRVA